MSDQKVVTTAIRRWECPGCGTWVGAHDAVTVCPTCGGTAVRVMREPGDDRCTFCADAPNDHQDTGECASPGCECLGYM